MADLTYAYAADITKAERDENGDLIVYGKATGPDVDLDEQICDEEWLKSAMPAWAEWSNIREMHQPICAGVGMETEAQGDDWWVRSKVLDDSTAKKIEGGGLRGYSVGIKHPKVVKDAKARGGRIVGGEIVEISYVDRPCNPTARMMISKAVGAGPSLAFEPVELADAEEFAIHVGGSRFTPSDLAKLLAKKVAPAVAKSDDDDDDKDGDDGKPDDDSGNGDSSGSSGGDGDDSDGDKDQKKKAKAKAKADKKAAKQTAQASGSKTAMAPLKPGGKPRYPIKSVDDLKDAIQAFGRGKAADRADIKAHIISEAKRLGRPDLIPDGWKAADADLGKAGKDQNHDPAGIAAVRDGLVALINAELQELCDGEPELCDVEQLLCSLRLLMSWWSKEADAGETDPPYTNGGSDMAYVGLDATPDQTTAPTPDATKTAPEPATAEAEADAAKTTEPDAGKADGSDEHDRLTEMVKSAVAEQVKSLTKKVTKKAAKERDALAVELDQVKADLAKALSLPEPGGPVLTRTPAQATAAKASDAQRLKRDADQLLTKAADVEGYDPRLASGYRARAQELLNKAAA